MTLTPGQTRAESKYSSSDPIKSPTSGIPTVSEPMLMGRVRRVWDVVCA